MSSVHGLSNVSNVLHIHAYYNEEKKKFLLSDSCALIIEVYAFFSPDQIEFLSEMYRMKLMNLQDSPTLMLKHASMHERDPKTKVWRHSFTAFR